MKALPFKVLRSTDETFIVQKDQESFFYDSYHLHDEIQLSLINEGSGTLITGNYIGRFEPGDLFLIGSNIPHVFRCESKYYENTGNLFAEMFTIFIHRDHFEQLTKLPEAKELQNIARMSRKCQHLPAGEISDDFKEKIWETERKKGVEKLVHVLNLLRCLAENTLLRPLLKLPPDDIVGEKEGKRLDNVLNYILKNYSKQISLQEISDVANLSPGSFCRFFKQRTRKTLFDFISEVRLNKACSELRESDKSISMIAYSCGFNNLAYFNRRFKAYYGMTPSGYLSSFRS